MLNLLQSALGRMRIIALLEGLSYLILLFIAMPLKYGFDMPEFVRVVGMAHGVLFIAYVYQLAVVKWSEDWGWGKTFVGFVASLIPFGTFWADRQLFRETKPEPNEMSLSEA